MMGMKGIPMPRPGEVVLGSAGMTADYITCLYIYIYIYNTYVTYVYIDLLIYVIVCLLI